MAAEGCGIAAFGGDDYKVSVTGFPLVPPIPHDVVPEPPSPGRGLYTAAKRPPKPSRPKAVPNLRTLGAEAPSIFRTLTPTGRVQKSSHQNPQPPKAAVKLTPPWARRAHQPSRLQGVSTLYSSWLVPEFSTSGMGWAEMSTFLKVLQSKFLFPFARARSAIC